MCRKKVNARSLQFNKQSTISSNLKDFQRFMLDISNGMEVRPMYYSGPASQVIVTGCESGVCIPGPLISADVLV